MDPYAPASVPRRKRGGGTTFERNDGPKDFRAKLTQEQQNLFNPTIGTTRFAYQSLNGTPSIKFKSVIQHKSLVYQKRSSGLMDGSGNSTGGNTGSARFAAKKKSTKRNSSSMSKSGKGGGDSMSGSDSSSKNQMKKPKVDNRTKWRRRLAIDGSNEVGGGDVATNGGYATYGGGRAGMHTGGGGGRGTHGGGGGGPHGGVGSYVAVGMPATEAKKTAIATCILVYVPPKRTAAEAKKAAEEKKQAEEAAKRAGFPVASSQAQVQLPGQSSYKLDKNGKPSLAPGQHVDKAGFPVDGPPSHRASCHRCGNLRRKILICPRCPHVFCLKCSEKMFEEHGVR